MTTHFFPTDPRLDPPTVDPTPSPEMEKLAYDLSLLGLIAKDQGEDLKILHFVVSQEEGQGFYLHIGEHPVNKTPAPAEWIIEILEDFVPVQ